jgi:hypothetical protein
MEVEEVKCALCGKEISPDDLTYPNVHYKCSEKFYKEMENLGVMKILWKKGTQMSFKLSGPFGKELDKTLDDVRFHVITDETVDDDLITMQGVLRTAINYLQKRTSDEKIYHCAELVFNSLMTQKYGSPLPNDKKFHSRVKEFLKEVFSVPIDEDMANHLKAFRKLRWGM